MICHGNKSESFFRNMRDVRSKYWKFTATRVFVSVFRRKGRCDAKHLHGWEKILCQTFLLCSGDGGWGDGKTDFRFASKNRFREVTKEYNSLFILE